MDFPFNYAFVIKNILKVFYEAEWGWMGWGGGVGRGARKLAGSSGRGDKPEQTLSQAGTKRRELTLSQETSGCFWIFASSVWCQLLALITEGNSQDPASKGMKFLSPRTKGVPSSKGPQVS